MATANSNRRRAERRAAKTPQETPSVEGQEEKEATNSEPVLSPLEQDAVNIANAVELIRASYKIGADYALKIVDLTLTARMQALALKAQHGTPFPFTPAPAQTPEGVGDDGATSEAPLTEVEEPQADA